MYKIVKFVSDFNPVYKKRIMGIDWGKERVGLSLSDQLWILAKPLTILEKKTNYSVFNHLIELLTEYDIGGIVLGMPSSLQDDTPHLLHEKIIKFAQAVLEEYTCPILLWNENFSSQDAQKFAPRSKFIDDIAATLLLQSVLDQPILMR